jgi:hypothetical protein
MAAELDAQLPANFLTLAQVECVDNGLFGLLRS